MSGRALRLGLAARCAPAARGKRSPSRRRKSRPPSPSRRRPSLEPPPPYEPQLLRLAEIIGALAYLRDLCGGHDGDAWRAEMTRLLDAEATTQTRRESLAGAYNTGFRGYELSYRACTPAAREVIARFLDEAAKISTDVAARYGG